MSEVLDPDLVTVRFTALTQAGRHAQAVALAEGQLAHHRDNELIWYLAAVGQANTANPAESERSLLKALALRPDFLPALVLLAGMLSRGERPDEAVDVAHRAVTLHPDDPSAHFAVASTHFARHGNGTDLWTALEAARHTIKLAPEHEDAAALAARAADLLGLNDQATALLREGLARHPNSVVLLQAAGTVDGGERVVGDRAPLLTSVLAGNPFDTGSAEDLRRLAFASVRPLLWLPWLQGILFGLGAGLALPHRSGAAGLALALTAAALALSLFAFRRAERRFPPGYLRGEFKASPRARKAVWLAGAAEVWVSASALWIALSGGGQAAAAALALAALPVVASQHLLGQGEHPELFAGWTSADIRARRYYWNQRVQAYLATRRWAWAGLIPGIAGLSVAGLSESATPAVAGAGLCLAALLWLARAAYLTRLQLALGADNPFVTGRTLQQPAGREKAARRRGAFGAAVYTLRIVIVSLMVLVYGAVTLVDNAIP